MTHGTSAMHGKAHPAPHRHEVGLGTLAFAVLAGPAAWSFRLLFNYGLASSTCFPDPWRGLGPPSSNPEWLRVTMLASEGVAILIAALGAVVAFHIWQSARHEAEGHAEHLLEVGEGRTRFLGLWGLIISIGFLVVDLFDAVGLMVLPSCG